MSRRARFPENDGVNVERLRAETRDEHEAVEELVPLMGNDLTRAQYVDVLQRLYPVVRGWEIWALDHAPAIYRGLLAERQRSEHIQRDLHALGADPASENTNPIERRLTAAFAGGAPGTTATAASFLGAMYVMEGSTLGGQYIAKHVQDQLALDPGQGNAYFRGYAEKTGSMWQSFRQHLIDLPEEQGGEVIAAAKAMFGIFGGAMLPV